jgi:AcrR family transcriptional regulator
LDSDWRKQAILDAARDVFTENGFATATTLEIASRAGVSKRDLYRMFQSKQGLLDGLIARFTRTAMLPPVFPPPADQSDFLETLRQFGRVFLRELLHPQRIALYRLAISESPKSTRLGEAL